MQRVSHAELEGLRLALKAAEEYAEGVEEQYRQLKSESHELKGARERIVNLDQDIVSLRLWFTVFVLIVVVLVVLLVVVAVCGLVGVEESFVTCYSCISRSLISLF